MSLAYDIFTANMSYGNELFRYFGIGERKREEKKKKKKWKFLNFQGCQRWRAWGFGDAGLQREV